MIIDSYRLGYQRRRQKKRYYRKTGTERVGPRSTYGLYPGNGPARGKASRDKEPVAVEKTIGRSGVAGRQIITAVLAQAKNIRVYESGRRDRPNRHRFGQH